VAQLEGSHTGRFLRELIEKGASVSGSAELNG
jgi:hypothetical protein